VLDEGLGRLGLLPKPKDKPAREFQYLPLIGVFGREHNFSGSAASIDQFYDQYQEMIGYERGLKLAEASKDSAQLARLQSQARGKVWLSRVDELKAGYTVMRDLGDAVDAVYRASPDQMDPDQKRAALDRIRARMVHIARGALGKPGLKQ